MKKKGMWLLVSLLAVSMILTISFSGCRAEEPVVEEPVAEEPVAEEPAVEEPVAEEPVEEAPAEAPVFGNIPVALADEWNGYGVEAFKYAADLKGVDVVVLDSEWDGEKALKNLEDMITKEVDEIGVFVYTPEQAQDFILRANEAGIPISFENTKLVGTDIEGEFVFNVACEYYNIGYEAMKYISQNWPDSKVFYVRGLPGMGIVEEYQRGVDDAVAEFGNIELVASRDTDWGTEQSMNVTQDVIQAGIDFDVIFANSEEMAIGVYSALQDAGIDEEINMVATGGGPTGVEMMEAGQLEATISAPVSLQGLWLFKAMWLHYNGIEPPEKFIPLPTIPIDIDSLDDNISWQVTDWHIDYIGGLDEW